MTAEAPRAREKAKEIPKGTFLLPGRFLLLVSLGLRRKLKRQNTKPFSSASNLVPFRHTHTIAFLTQWAYFPPSKPAAHSLPLTSGGDIELIWGVAGKSTHGDGHFNMMYLILIDTELLCGCTESRAASRHLLVLPLWSKAEFSICTCKLGLLPQGSLRKCWRGLQN